MRKVWNLLKDNSYSEYLNQSAREALVTEYMLNNNLASKIHNEKMRQEFDSKIEICGKNGRTLILGDFGTKNV